VKGSRDLLFEFWDPSISREWLKLEASNVPPILTTGSTHERNAKLGQKGVRKGVRDILLKCWEPLHISGTGEARNFKFGTHIEHYGH